MERTSSIDLWIWMLVAAGLFVMRVYPGFIPELGHDSFQYLSGADNALAGRIGYTSLIHYDVERSFGVLPAPMMTFPSGYPLTIAALSLSGLSTQSAALLLSVAATLACIALLVWLGRALGLSRALRNVMVACFVANGIVAQYSVAALSEPLFMFLVLLGFAALVKARLYRDGLGVGYWIAGGLAIGASYFVRYAGLFFVVGLGVLFVRHLVDRRSRLHRGHAVAWGTAALFVVAGIARNLMLVGNWRGRGEMVINNPLKAVLAQTAQAINGLALGVGTTKGALVGTFVPKLLLAGLLIVGIALLTLDRRRAEQRSAERATPIGGVGVDLLLLCATYVACMVYAARTSSISYGAARHFLPILPLVLLLIGLLLRFLLAPADSHHARRRIAIAALALGLCCYVYLNTLVIRKPRVDEEAAVAEQFGPDADASRAAILDLTGRKGAIFANNGQAVGYFLGLPTISTVNSEFSGIVWDEGTVRATIRQFHIAALVITTPVEGQGSKEADFPSPFLRSLSQGTAPEWLKLRQRSGHVLTYVPVSANLQ